MDINIVSSKEEGAEIAFKLFQDQLNKNSESVFGLATGSSPEAFYKKVCESELDFSKATSINLDEYVGLDQNDPQSYYYFMKKHLFNKKTFKKNYLPNGKANDLTKETKRYDQIIADNPIDIQILGIGRNAHIGFNEPGTSFEIKTHLVDLTPSTIEANARFFKEESDVPKQAISMGISSIMQAKKIILFAYGADKATAIKNSLTGKISETVPGSILQKHPNVTVIIDKSAASELNTKQ